MPDPVLRLLDPDDQAVGDEAYSLGRLAFGVDPALPRRPQPGRRQWGAYEAGRLVAKVAVHDYEQWWGGQKVQMAGLSGVAAHPDVRGRGLVRRLVGLAEADMRERGQVVSALYPTASAIYRSLGWELVGSLDWTRLPVGALPSSGPLPVRRATPDDVPAIAAAYEAWGRARSGLISRTGSSFPTGPAGVLEHDVVGVAEVGGQVVGYVAYARGLGMGPQAELVVDELVAPDPEVQRSLLASLASWSSVVGAVVFRGPTEELALALGPTVPPAHERRPWMLRLVDPVAAVAARGWPVDGAASFDLPGTGPVRLEVSGGEGRLEALPGAPDLPRVQPRGLAVLWAGASSTSALGRSGLVDRPVPALDALCAGGPPAILDYF